MDFEKIVQNISTTIAQTRNLYQSNFEAKKINEQEKKRLFEIKLKDQYKYGLNKYEKMQNEQKKQEEKKVEENDHENFLGKVVEEMINENKDEKNKIKTFEKYEGNVDEVKYEKKEVRNDALVVSNKLEMNLSQSTKLGTIKASSIRKLVKPTWHAPYKLYRVIVGHQGWVRAIAISPCNTYFATGSADRTIKFWDLASGQLKISLTGHINTIRGLEFSQMHPYLFSCGEDKAVKCWDLQMNRTIRSYHGHLSGVYCLKLHHGLSVLITGGRDSTARVWDIRVRRQIHSLVGHEHTVGSIVTQQNQPHVITGGYDSFVKLWDIGQGKCIKTLTNHKKSIRTMVEHPKQYTFATAASDNIKVWKSPQGEFLRNITGHNSIIDSMAVNDDGVLVTGGDDGTMRFWDWSSGYNFQTIVSQPQPGSIAAENAVFSLAFDRSGSRLLSGQCDKTIKLYKQDENASQETHPIQSYKMQFY